MRSKVHCRGTSTSAGGGSAPISRGSELTTTNQYGQSPRFGKKGGTADSSFTKLLKELLCTSTVRVTHSYDMPVSYLIQSNLVVTDPDVAETSISRNTTQAADLLPHLNLSEHNRHLAITEAERRF